MVVVTRSRARKILIVRAAARTYRPRARLLVVVFAWPQPITPYTLLADEHDYTQRRRIESGTRAWRLRVRGDIVFYSRARAVVLGSRVRAAVAGLIGGVLALWVALWGVIGQVARNHSDHAARSVSAPPSAPCRYFHNATAGDTVYFEVALAPGADSCTITLRRP